MTPEEKLKAWEDQAFQEMEKAVDEGRPIVIQHHFAGPRSFSAVSLDNRVRVLQLPDGRYLANDFTTWTTDVEEAHRFIPGAALNSCWEEFRRIGARVVIEETKI